jgi:putative endonuclease
MADNVRFKIVALAKEDLVEMFYYVYVLICNNRKPYVGCTNNLKERIERHNKGYVSATKSLLPVKLVSYFVFSNKYTASILKNILNPDPVEHLLRSIT